MHIAPSRKGEFVAVAKRLVAPSAKARYLTIQGRTGVPWWFVAVVHEREASQRWDRHLGQGDPLNHKTTHVPKNRGPFFGPTAFEDGAVDALVSCAPYAARNRDWSIGSALAWLEMYNGLGYAAKHVPSPYDWSGSDQYKSGKYVADHVYSASAVDRQLGCAALLACMAELDPDVHFDGTAPVPTKPVDKPAPTPAKKKKDIETAGGTTAGGTVVAAASSGHTWALVVAGVIVAAVIGYIVYTKFIKKD